MPEAAMKADATPEQNRDALQAALDQGGPVALPVGCFPFCAGAVPKGSGQVIRGVSKHATILDCRGTGAFLSDGETWGFEIHDLQMVGKLGPEPSSGMAIVMDGSMGSQAAPWQMQNPRIVDVLLDGFVTGLIIRDQNNARIEGLRMAAMRGDGIVAECVNPNLRTDALTIRDFTFDTDASALALGRGTGIVIDGAVQTIDLFNVNLVRPYRGVDVRNTAKLPFGQHAAFLQCTGIKVDYPIQEAISISDIDGFHAINCYFHGSAKGNGITFGAGTREVSFVGCKVTSHASNGILHSGADLDIAACRIDDNGQVESNASGLAVVSPARVSVLAGSLSNPKGAYGINRAHPGCAVSLAGDPRLVGRFGPKNF